MEHSPYENVISLTAPGAGENEDIKARMARITARNIALQPVLKDVHGILAETGPIPLPQDLSADNAVCYAGASHYYQDVGKCIETETGPVVAPSDLASIDDGRRYYESVERIAREVGRAIPLPGAGVVTSAAALEYYNSVRDSRVYGVAPAMQCKMVVMGDVAAGKTSLLRALRGGVAVPTRSRADDPTVDATQGADVYCWRPYDVVVIGMRYGPYDVVSSAGDDTYGVANGGTGSGETHTVDRDTLLAYVAAATGTSDRERLAIHAYDLGGHEAYRATQQIHFAGEVLYLVVFDASKSVDDCVMSVRNWLQALSLRAPAARVIIVGAHGDNCIEPNALREALFVSAKSWRGSGNMIGLRTASDIAIVSSVGSIEGVAALKSRIVDSVLDAAQFPGVCAAVPRLYIRMDMAVRRLRRSRTIVPPKDLFEALLELAPPGKNAVGACSGTQCTSLRCSTPNRAFGRGAHRHDHCAMCGGCIGKSCLQYRDGKGLCAACIEGGPAPRALAWLASVGAVVHLTDDDLLREYVALSPQVLVDALRRLIGDPELMTASASSAAVAAAGRSYLVDGVLHSAQLKQAWGPITNRDDQLTLVLYEMIRKFDMFVPLDVAFDGRDASLRAVPERTLVPCMLRYGEPEASKEFWSSVGNNRAADSEMHVLVRRYALTVVGGGASRATPYGLLHRLMVRVGSARNQLSSSAFWCDGWSGVYAESGIYARVCVVRSSDGEHVLLSVAGAPALLTSWVARTLKMLRESVHRLMAEWSGGAIVEEARCPCDPSCSCWLSATDIETARSVSSRVRCGCGRSVRIGLVDPELAAVADVAPPVRAPVLAVICASPLVFNGVALSAIKYDLDVERVKDAIRAAGCAVELEVRFAGVDNFMAVAARRPAVLQFSGHGDAPSVDVDAAINIGTPSTASAAVAAAGAGSTSLVFECPDGSALFVDAQILKKFFTRFPPTSLVILSACCSYQTGLHFVRAGAKHVVATTTDVENAKATAFCASLYHALLFGAGMTIADAFEAADTAVTAKRIGTAAEIGFVLLPDDESHNVSPFESLSRGTKSYPSNVYDAIPLPSIGIIGRENETAAVLALLETHLRVLVHGAAEVGKSVVAMAAAQYVSVRRVYDGVLFVDVAAAHTEEGVVYKISEAAAEWCDRRRVSNPDTPKFTKGKSLSHLATVFRDRKMLVVLDNCDAVVLCVCRVVDACGGGGGGESTTRFLLTQRSPVSDVCAPSARVLVDQLCPSDFGRLFEKSVPRRVTPSEIAPYLLVPVTGVVEMSEYDEALFELFGRCTAGYVKRLAAQLKGAVRLADLREFTSAEHRPPGAVSDGMREAMVERVRASDRAHRELRDALAAPL